MENASKALLISGTILIVILLIGVGIKLFDSTSPLSDQVTTSTQTTAASNFNSQFYIYFGNSVSPSKTRDFIKEVMKNNAKSGYATFSPELHQIGLLFYKKNNQHVLPGDPHKWKESDLQAVYNNIHDNQTYTIRNTYNCDTYGAPAGYYKNGYLICITIQENN